MPPRKRLRSGEGGAITGSSGALTTPIVLEDDDDGNQVSKFVVLANPVHVAVRPSCGPDETRPSALVIVTANRSNPQTEEFTALEANLHALRTKFLAQSTELARLRSAHTMYSQVVAQVLPAMQGLADTVALLQEVPPRYLEELVQMARNKGEPNSAAIVERLRGGHALAADHLQVAFKMITLFKPQLDEVDKQVFRKD